MANGKLSAGWEEDEEMEDSADGNNCEYFREVHRISVGILRAKLIAHFDIHFQKNNVFWPRRVGSEKTKKLLNRLSTLLSTMPLQNYHGHYRK